jgi:acetoin utilization deacetylase AcuC-like enzyme
MAVTPAGFGYMTGQLARLGIPLCLLLEGGYFVPIVAQCALHCVRALGEKVDYLQYI